MKNNPFAKLGGAVDQKLYQDTTPKPASNLEFQRTSKLATLASLLIPPLRKRWHTDFILKVNMLLRTWKQYYPVNMGLRHHWRKLQKKLYCLLMKIYWQTSIPANWQTGLPELQKTRTPASQQTGTLPLDINLIAINNSFKEQLKGLLYITCLWQADHTITQ